MLFVDEAGGYLIDAGQRRTFDPATRTWSSSLPKSSGEALSLVAAATWLQRRSGHPLRQPVAVIGPREASDAQLAAAEQVGAAMARIGFTVVCGGRQGVMEAVCRGVAAENGISIGLLPDAEAAAANAYVTVPIATGIGEARNAIVARSGFGLVVIGDSYGTLSEVALGLQFGRPVFGLLGAAIVNGVRGCENVDAAIDGVCKVALGLG
ncbi:hypothetical protein [Undibacter mobilis]|uniref:TIGR00725 family protein n=1 Tax=Undibacter mobilis TaxID=2292256 RepID=A0A371B1A1_9BRAD|nr:hypothetical protein [Undibacter mobilis]RDV01284.1 hypothetical protein DXH78_18820 [Undibacter mobilis]